MTDKTCEHLVKYLQFCHYLLLFLSGGVQCQHLHSHDDLGGLMECTIHSPSAPVTQDLQVL